MAISRDAAEKGRQFVEQLLKDGVSMDTAKSALGQLMVQQALAMNNGQKKATSKKLGITREWVREIADQARLKSKRLIPLREDWE
jgi:hypothetical protein